jgi:hypothetical protein
VEKEVRELEAMQARFAELGRNLARGAALMDEAERLCGQISGKQGEQARGRRHASGGG